MLGGRWWVVGTENDTENELDIENENDLDFDTENDIETENDTENELDIETDLDFDTETENETGFTPGLDPARRVRIFCVGGRPRSAVCAYLVFAGIL